MWDTISTVAIIAGLGYGAYYIITNKDTLFPPVGGDIGTTDGTDGGGNGDGDGDGGDIDGNGNGNGNGGNGNGNGDSGYDCAKACRNCWCKSYSENCGKGCSKCCGGSRIASKCGGKGVKSCSGGGGSSGDGGSFSSFAADILGAGLGRYPSYEDMFYPHNKQAMRMTIA